MTDGPGAKIEVTYLPSGKTVRVPEGTTLFNAAHWAGLPIESTCGGRGTCGKCGVQVLEGEAELSLADYRHLADKLDDGWRLSCQCPINGPMTVDVPRLMKMPKAATMGVGRFVLLEPNVVKLYLELPPPSLEDHRSHLRRVMDAVEEAGLHPQLRLGGPAEGRARPSATATNVTATLVGEYLVDCEEGDTRDRMFGVSFDIGTTTCVCTLVDLRNGATVARREHDQPSGLLRRRRDRADGQGDARPGEHRPAAGGGARDGERAAPPRAGGGRRHAARRSTRRWWPATPR